VNFYAKLGAVVDRYEKLVNAPVVVAPRPGKMMEYKLSCDAIIGFDIPSSFVFRQGVGGKLQIAERQYLLGVKAPVNVEYLNFMDTQKVELARAMGFGVLEPMPKTQARWAIVIPSVCKLFGIPYNNPNFTVAKLVDAVNKRHQEYVAGQNAMHEAWRERKGAERRQKETEALQKAQNNVPRNLSRWLDEAPGIDDMLDTSSYYSASPFTSDNS
jgi:hypothetical protein